MFGYQRGLANELLLLDGPEVLVHEVLRRGAGLQIVLSRQPAKPQQLTVAVKRVSTEAHGQRGGAGALCVRQDLCVLEEAVWWQLLQPVGGHVQADQLGEEGEGALADVVDQVVIQCERVNVGHSGYGFPGKAAQVVVGKIQVLDGGDKLIEGVGGHLVDLVVPQDEVPQVDKAFKVVAPDHAETVPIHVERPQGPQAQEGVRSDLADGVTGQGEVDQTGHVEKVFPAYDGDEVVGQTQLHRLAVDGRWHEQQAGLSTEQGQSGGEVLADAAAGAAVPPHQSCTQQHTQNHPLHC